MKKGGLINLFLFGLVLIMFISPVFAVEPSLEQLLVESGVSPNIEEAVALISFAIMFFLAIIILSIFIYIYTSLALMKIAKRTNTKDPWLAWVPVANMILLSRIAKMHWWPVLVVLVSGMLMILLFIPIIVTESLFLIIVFLISLFVFLVSSIILTIFSYIWWWKTFEAVGRPGWWILLSLIPYVGAIIVLVLIGIAAWGKKDKASRKA